MKKVKYNGDLDVIMPTLGIGIKKDDVIDVDDDFNNDLFTLVEDTNTSKKKGDN